MVNIETKLSGDITSGLDKLLAKAQGEVLLSGVAAMARVMYAEVLLNASPPRMGKVTGNLQSSIYRVYAGDESTDDKKVYKVSWNRTKAPHGHLLEFGTSKMAARPFLRPSLSRMPDATKAGIERVRQRLGG